MDINNKSLQALEESIQAKWTEAFNAPPQTQLNSLATRYTSTTASNNYAFLEALGQTDADQAIILGDQPRAAADARQGGFAQYLGHELVPFL